MKALKEFWDSAYGWLIGGAVFIFGIYLFATVPPKYFDSDIDCYKFVGGAVTGLREKPEGFAVYRDLITKAKEDGFISMDECQNIKDLSENVGKRKLVFQ